jgi:hypothetical protein
MGWVNICIRRKQHGRASAWENGEMYDQNSGVFRYGDFDCTLPTEESAIYPSTIECRIASSAGLVQVLILTIFILNMPNLPASTGREANLSARPDVKTDLRRVF